MFLCKPGS